MPRRGVVGVWYAVICRGGQNNMYVGSKPANRAGVGRIRALCSGANLAPVDEISGCRALGWSCLALCRCSIRRVESPSPSLLPPSLLTYSPPSLPLAFRRLCWHSHPRLFNSHLDHPFAHPPIPRVRDTVSYAIPTRGLHAGSLADCTRLAHLRRFPI